MFPFPGRLEPTCPTVTEALAERPSFDLYRKFQTAILRKHGLTFIEKIRTYNQHSHLLVVLRECQDHTDCLNSLYVTCTQLCADHTILPVTQLRLTGFLKQYFNL